MIAFKEEKFIEALKFGCSLFDTENLYEQLHEEQILTLRQFFLGKDLFFSAHTGYGKSLIFQMIPVISNYLQDKQIGSSVAVVISPLKALMKDQVEYLNSHTAISAVALTDM